MNNSNGHDLVLVYMVDDTPVGTRFQLWPLHMTLLPWFHAPDLGTVIQAVETIANRTPTIPVTVGERAHYGPNQKITVMTMNLPKQLQLLHKQLKHMTEQHGWELQGRYTGAQYSPHVTQQAGRDVTGPIMVDRIAIAEALPQGYRKLVAYVELAS